ncbi:MAG: DUF4038 domain-containing protein [Leadbetterella sp.]
MNLKNALKTIFILAITSLNLFPQAPSWEKHGVLRVSKNKRYLEHQDNTGFFWLGCTAWKLATLSPSEIDKYFKNRVEKGFTVIQLSLTNMKKPNYNGDKMFLSEPNAPWSKVEPNEAYWKHIDYIIERAQFYGLHLALIVMWGNEAADYDELRKPNTPPRSVFSNPDKSNFEFGQFLGKRFNKHPNILWVGAGEYHKPVSSMFPNNQSPVTELHKTRLEAIIKGILESDKPKKHLYSIHPVSFLSSSEEFHNAEWLDFNMIQSHALPEFIVPLTSADYQMTPAKPTFNSEAWYEAEEELFTRWTETKKANDEPLDPDWIQRLQAYWSVFSGGFGFTYGHKNIWSAKTSSDKLGTIEDPVLNAPGVNSLKHLRHLMESKPIQSRIPAPNLLSSGTKGRDGGLSPDLRIATQDISGKWAMVYSTRGSLIRVEMSQLPTGKFKAFWYNPKNGKWRFNDTENDTKNPFLANIEGGKKAKPVYFDPPEQPKDGNDWVLLLEIE